MTKADDRPKVLILVFSRLVDDGRVLRQVRSLSQHFQVTTAAFGPSPMEGSRHVELSDLPPYRDRILGRALYAFAFVLRLFPLISKFNRRDRVASQQLGGIEWDVVVANDVESIPLARRLAPRAGVLADVHEYATRQNEHSFLWRQVQAPYYRWLVKKHLAAARVVTTVSGGIADEYLREFGVRAQVVTNASAFHDLQPTQVSTPIRLVHSGYPAVQRRLELMIDAVRQSRADVVFDLYLLDDGSAYLSSLKARAVGDDRIRFREPVESRDLVTVLNDYDVGLSILPPTTFNLAWCLPNKFFDYVQARLGLIVGPSPEMQRVVERSGFGHVTPDFSVQEIANAIEQLDTEVIARWKKAAHAHAEELSSGPQSNIWVTSIDQMTNQPNARD